MGLEDADAPVNALLTEQPCGVDLTKMARRYEAKA
jgi:hypothetical protein